MKFAGKFFLAGSLAAFGFSSVADGQQNDCRVVAAEVQSLIQGAPAMTLTVVEDALVANPGCVCEIIRTAIAASNADAVMVKKIVYTAVTTTQQHAPTIAECAVAAAPEHADAVRAAFAEAFEDVDRKKPGKKPVQVASSEKPKPAPKPTSSAPKPAPKPAATAPAAPTSYAYQGGKTVVAETSSGKQVVEYQPSYASDPKGIAAGMEPDEGPVEPPVAESEFGTDPEYIKWTTTLFHGPPPALTGLYLVPPVASAPPFDPEMEEEHEDDPPRRRISFPPRRSPNRPPVMSPTGP